LRRVNDLWPLPVRWQLAGAAPARPDAAAGFADILAAFAGFPAWCLVILGPGGRRQERPGDQAGPPPAGGAASRRSFSVLLPAAAWTSESTLLEWMAEQPGRH
jgi:hypothetical protein